MVFVLPEWVADDKQPDWNLMQWGTLCNTMIPDEKIKRFRENISAQPCLI